MLGLPSPWSKIMVVTLSCLICDSPLSAISASKEHVIPNALGGRLKTTRATCVGCNSSSGHGADVRLVRQFHLLANALDVVRDRDDHPEAAFIDPNTGRKYRMEPGKNPILAPNIRVERSGSTIKYRFTAPTRAAAERLLNDIRPRKPHTESDLVGTQCTAEKFTWDFGYSADDETLLRSVARIAACYVRHVGIPIDHSEPTVRFARGEDVGRCPVGPPRSDVVSILGLPEHPLYHGIFLSKPADRDPLLAYIVLFQCCEFLVEFNADCTSGPIHSCYQLNLVTGCAEDRSFEWILDTYQACEWIRYRKIDVEHMKKRVAPLLYYLSRRERLWIDRAIGIGMNRFYESRDRGATKEQASANALAQANQVLSRYAMTIEKLEINESDGVAHP